MAQVELMNLEYSSSRGSNSSSQLELNLNLNTELNIQDSMDSPEPRSKLASKRREPGSNLASNGRIPIRNGI